jgi:hypothetical protein
VGQGYTRKGITVTVLDEIEAGNNDSIVLRIVITNQSGRDQIIAWDRSNIHLRDDTGIEYGRWWGGVDQIMLSSGKSYSIGIGSEPYLYFWGPLNPSATELIISIDQIYGMKDLNWRYHLQ